MPEKLLTASPLYFVAIVIPEPAFSAVTSIKKDMELNYASKAALKSPPHITLHMPFRLADKKLGDLEQVIGEVASQTGKFDIILKDFGAFPPGVIYVSVEENKELESLQSLLLRKMRKALNVFNGNYKERAFHPHVTVAFRDLKTAQFKLAWEQYQKKEIRHVVQASELTLLKHDGKKWEAFQAFKLNGN